MFGLKNLGKLFLGSSISTYLQQREKPNVKFF